MPAAPAQEDRNLGGEIDRLGFAITNLTEAVRELRADIGEIRSNLLEDFGAIRTGMRTDFARLIDRQDSHFRWLAGIMIASAIALASLAFKILQH